ncbi:unnamed protein product [Schistocephalus solidus]|uniref:Elongation factor Ts, mitochondrial n=1 Tax=Schistocephalus solidus TaxID=70667 RepID=A0A3P7D002_SCHSO|nr:unnamed protein product [Schistocephalus solidus]
MLFDAPKWASAPDQEQKKSAPFILILDLLCQMLKYFSPELHPLVATFMRNSTTSTGSTLAKLRKMTGHPFNFCREALTACDGDYERAIQWLQKEASKRGLAKAEKLRSRPMSQGLLGLLCSSKCVAAVEVNCETDFVARNQEFQSLVASVTESFHKFLLVRTYTFCCKKSGNDGLQKFQSESLRDLPIVTAEGKKSLSGALADCVHSVGENMAVSRAVGMKLLPDEKTSKIMAYCHMSTAGGKRNLRNVQFGKYVAFIRYRLKAAEEAVVACGRQDRASQVALQLCQHIVGMNPRPGLKLSPPAENPDDERCLLLQKFLLDETIDIRTLLELNNIQLEEFLRIECGQEE